MSADFFHNRMIIFQGEYIRVWVPELVNILKGKVHAPWTLRQGELGAVKLGVDYPSPMVIAQEWSRHLDKTVIFLANFFRLKSAVLPNVSLILFRNLRNGPLTKNKKAMTSTSSLIHQRNSNIKFRKFFNRLIKN